MCRIKILLSIPEDFKDRFFAFISNVNAVNTDRGTAQAPIRIEQVIHDKPKEPAAVPKIENGKGENIENKD